jgi:hypothetical protein
VPIVEPVAPFPFWGLIDGPKACDGKPVVLDGLYLFLEQRLTKVPILGVHPNYMHRFIRNLDLKARVRK